MTTDLAATPTRPTNVLAIVAVIAAVILPLVGIVLGIVARGQITRTGEAGRGLAATAIAVGVTLSVISLAAVGLAAGILFSTGQLVGVHW